MTKNSAIKEEPKDGSIQLLKQFGREGDIKDLLNTVESYLDMIRCEEGKKILQQVRQSIFIGSSNPQLAQSLESEIDKTLKDRFEIEGLMSRCYDILYEYGIKKAQNSL